MENEEKMDVETWVDEGMREAGIDEKTETDVVQADEPKEQPETAEEKVEEKTTEETGETAEEKPEETESSIVKLLETPEAEAPKQVPLETHTKLRKRAQEAEARALMAERQLAEANKPAEDEGDILDGLDDDEPVRAGEVKKAVAKATKKARQESVAEVKEILAKQILEAQAINAVKSEANFRKEHADYDEVTIAANSLGLITDEDRKEIFASKNPAELFYKIAKTKRQAVLKHLGITQESTTTKTTTKETGKAKEQTEVDEEIEEIIELDDIYG